jgi:hypothetical protein
LICITTTRKQLFAPLKKTVVKVPKWDMKTNYNIAKFNYMEVHDIGDIPILMYWLIIPNLAIIHTMFSTRYQ